MLDKFQNKVIDKLSKIDLVTIMELFDCKVDDVGSILTDYFAKRTYFNGTIDLTRISGIISLGNIRRIDGDLITSLSTLEDLGELRILKGDLVMVSSRVYSTNKLIYCENIYVYGGTFREIKNMTEIRGNINLHNTLITTLNKLQLIGGQLNLHSNYHLESLGDIREVYGNVVINNCDKLLSLGTLYHIDGCLDVRRAKLESFGMLGELNGFVISLKSKVRNLYESGLEVVDFTPLTNVFGGMPKAIYLVVPKIDNLKNFGMIVIDDTNDDK